MLSRQVSGALRCFPSWKQWQSLCYHHQVRTLHQSSIPQIGKAQNTVRADGRVQAQNPGYHRVGPHDQDPGSHRVGAHDQDPGSHRVGDHDQDPGSHTVGAHDQDPGSHTVGAHDQDPGIYAVSSGHGRCGVSVLRLSGKGIRNAVLRLGKKSKLPRERMAVLWKLYHPTSYVQIDQALVLWFEGPRSFTGEDVCELHVHGGPAVVAAILDALASLPGLRPAQPGEFTKRAFQNGKLDLTEVEGLGDLIHAETEAQRRQALRQMQGALSAIYTQWRTSLVKCLANTEAFIDFSEDENIEDDVIIHVSREVSRVRGEVERHLADRRRGERLRSGVNVAIVGRPNVGKSSLLNAITQRDSAIVSAIPGTTRDVIEKTLDIGGFPVLLCDTAGLRDSDDVIEQQGVFRARKRAGEADVCLLVLEASELLAASTHAQFSLPSFIRAHLLELGLSVRTAAESDNEQDQESEDGELVELPRAASHMSGATGVDQQAGSVELALESVSLESVVLVLNKRDLLSLTDEQRLTQLLLKVTGSGVQLPGRGVQLPGRGVQVAGSGVQMVGSDVQVAGSGVQVAGSGVQVVGSGVQMTGSGVQMAGSGVQMAGRGVQVVERGVQVAERGVQVAGSGVQMVGSGVQVAGSGVQLTRNGMQVAGSGMQVAVVSCATEQGLGEFLELFTDTLRRMCACTEGDSPTLTQARHRAHLRSCLASLRGCEQLLSRDVVLAAEQLHRALRHVGRVTGGVTTDEILDVIFRDFCIGK